MAQHLFWIVEGQNRTWLGQDWKKIKIAKIVKTPGQNVWFKQTDFASPQWKRLWKTHPGSVQVRWHLFRWVCQKTSSHHWEIFIPFRFCVISGSLVQLRGKRYPNLTTASMLPQKYSIEIYQFGSWMPMAKISLHLLLSLLLLVITYLFQTN